MITKALTEAKPGETVWDKNEPRSVKGLHLRVSPSGMRSFYMYYKAKTGRERRFKLGTYPDISLQQARVAANAIRMKVIVGEDPKGDWNKAKGEMLVSELFQLTYDTHWSSKDVSSQWKQEAHRLYFRNISKRFGDLRLSEVIPPKVKDWHRSMSDTPTDANRSLAVLSKMFNVAEDREIIAYGANPCTRVKRFTEKKRKRFATADEIQAIWKKLEEEYFENPVSIAYLMALLYTGARPSTFERAKWTDIKRPGGAFVLEFNGKSTNATGEQESVVIPHQVWGYIDNLPRRPDGKIFGMHPPRKVWDRICRELNIEDLWIRDLRRTFATVGLSNGVGVGIIGELLNHKSAQTTKIYAKLINESKIEASQTIGDKLEQIIGG